MKTSSSKLALDACTMFESKEYRTAIELFTHALSIDTAPVTLFNRALCHKRLFSVQSAKDDLRLCLAEDPNFASAHKLMFVLSCLNCY